MERGRVARVTARWPRGAVIACGLLAFAATEIAHAQGRLRGDIEGPRGPRAGERVGAATAEPPPPPPQSGSPPGGSTNPFPGPGFPSLPVPGPNPGGERTGGVGVGPFPGPRPGGPSNASPAGSTAIFSAPAGGAAGSAALSLAAPARSVATPSSAAPGGGGSPSTAAGTPRTRITEIIPPSGSALGAQASAARSAGQSPIGGADPLAGTAQCVNVFVRSSNVDGREVVSVDLHGDGLIKGAVPPQLAGELLRRAGPPTGDARAACVPTALAQRLFDPVINLAAADPAVRMARVGDRWVLAGSNAPAQAARPQSERVQLAAATTTRGSSKAKRSPTKPRPIRVSYNIYP